MSKSDRSSTSRLSHPSNMLPMLVTLAVFHPDRSSEVRLEQ